MNSSENPKVEEGTVGSSPRATGCSLLWLRDLVKQPPPTEPHTLPKEEFPPSPYIRLAHRWTTRGSRNEKRPGLEELSNSGRCVEAGLLWTTSAVVPLDLMTLPLTSFTCATG